MKQQSNIVTALQLAQSVGFMCFWCFTLPVYIKGIFGLLHTSCVDDLLRVFGGEYIWPCCFGELTIFNAFTISSVDILFFFFFHFFFIVRVHANFYDILSMYFDSTKNLFPLSWFVFSRTFYTYTFLSHSLFLH